MHSLPQSRKFLTAKNRQERAKKPSENTFLTAHRQERADRNALTGKVIFSCRMTVRNLFLTAVPDGQPKAGPGLKRWPIPDGITVRKPTNKG
jgi:hypothetical protein